MEGKKTPLRMCLACRQMKEKNALLRIVKKSDGSVEIDGKTKTDGRGAYVCKNGECVKKLQKNRLLHKAFSCDVGNEIYGRIEEAILGGK